MSKLDDLINIYSKKGPKFRLQKLNEDLDLIKDLLPGISDIPQEDLFLYKESLTEIPKCHICKSNRKFINYKKGYQITCHSKECIQKYSQQKREEGFLKKYGVKNPKQIKEVNDKIKNTNLERYGHENAASSQTVKNKIKNTFIDNYGVDNPMKDKNIRNKVKKTNLERYGVENTYQMKKVLDKIKEKYGNDFGFGSDFFKNKSKETCNKKYGVDYNLQRTEIHKIITETMKDLYGGRGLGSDEIRERIYDEVERIYGERHPMHNKEIKNKLEETNLKKYGETHYMKVSELFDNHMKNSYKVKKLQLPSGKIVSVQGYEPFAINWFLENGYDEEDLMISTKEIENEIGKIKYHNPIKNKESRYYPDIYIKSENRIIEVKSEYTYKQNKTINEAKGKACIEKGLDFDFMIFTKVNEDVSNFFLRKTS